MELLKAASALLLIAACTYSLGASHGASLQQYTTAAAPSTQAQPTVVMRTDGAAAAMSTSRPSSVVVPRLRPRGATMGSDANEGVEQGRPLLAGMIGLGAMATAVVLFVWKAAGALRAKDSTALAEAEWRTAALELEEGFPGPGSPDAEYEVTVVWGGEERTLKIKGDQSILMACEEAGLTVPYLCRHGVCLECTAKVTEGIEHARRDSQCHDSENVKAGYVCTCSTYVGGNGMKVQMGMVEEAYKKQFGKFEEEERQREEKKKKSFLA